MDEHSEPRWGALLDGLGPLAGKRLLALLGGGGTGATSVLQLAVERGAAVWGVDASPADLGRARLAAPDVDLRIGDGNDLPFDSATFDVVCSFGTHTGARLLTGTIDEMQRVCRPGGLVAIVTTKAV